jgi:phage terminase large subunit
VIDVLPRDAAGRVRFLPPKGFTSWPPVAEWTEAHWSSWMLQRGYSPAEVAQFLDTDRFRYGVGFTATGAQAQPHNAYEKGTRWLYTPTPKGVTLHETRDSDVSNILWGGSAGGAKSMSARWEAIAECLFSPRDGYRAIVIRRELEELRRSHLDKIEGEAVRLCEAIGDDKAIKVTSQPPCATFRTTGGKIIFGHAAEDGSELKYLSEEYDLFLGDEATLLRWKQITGIQSRVRNDTKIGRKGRMILTTNPGGPSHQDCVDHFITKKVDLTRNPRYRPETYRFIPSSLFDNMHLMDSDGGFGSYEERLYLLDPDRRRQLLEGDWSAIVDQYFPTFDPALHVRSVA